MATEKRRRAKANGVLASINLNAAGIDVGATQHYVAIPPDRGEPTGDNLCEWSGYGVPPS